MTYSRTTFCSVKGCGRMVLTSTNDFPKHIDVDGNVVSADHKPDFKIEMR